MSGGHIAFIIWIVCSLMFVGEGIFCFFTKKQVGFWANAKTPEMQDVKAYNRAVGKLWITFGSLFMILGLPLLADQNSVWIIFVSLGAMVWCIMLAVVYMRIENRYRKKM